MMINTSTFSKGLIIFLVCYLEIFLKRATARLQEEHSIVPIERNIRINKSLFDLLKEENNGKKFAIDLKTIKNKKITTSQLKARIIPSVQLGIKHVLLKVKYPTFETDSHLNNAHIQLCTRFSNMSDETFREFTFFAYAPYIFDSLRIKFDIDKNDYVSSFCDTALKELPNPGASISQLYFTKDNKFIMKTVVQNENECLLNLISKYHQHFEIHPKSLLPKFSGFFSISRNPLLPLSTFKVVTMNNLLPSNIRMNQKFDLKGSTLGRQYSGPVNIKNVPTYKDLDFNEKYPSGILLKQDIFLNLIQTLQYDCNLLESLNIMDYSLLMGIFNIDRSSSNNQYKIKLRDAANKKWTNAMGTTERDISIEDDSGNEYTVLFRDCIPAKNVHGEKLLLFVGIIDVLQTYKIKKIVESNAKKLSLKISSSSTKDGNSISVQPPDVYSRRFMDYMSKSVFTTDYSSSSKIIPLITLLQRT